LTARTLSRRTLLASCAAGATVALAGGAFAQQGGEDRDNARPDGGQVDPVTGKVCRPMCAEDMSPCDPPAMKAREGRCSSPSAGFVG